MSIHKRTNTATALTISFQLYSPGEKYLKERKEAVKREEAVMRAISHESKQS